MGGGGKIFKKVFGGGGGQKFLFWWGGNFVGGEGLLKRFAPFSYLNHSFILGLNLKVWIRFIVFLKISLCFLIVKSYVG